MLIVISVPKKSTYCNGVITYYSKKEFMLFELIISSAREQKIEKDNIVNYIWRERAAGISLNNISQLTYRVRKKIKASRVPIEIIFSSVDGFKVRYLHKVRRIYVNAFLFGLLETFGPPVAQS